MPNDHQGSVDERDDNPYAAPTGSPGVPDAAGMDASPAEEAFRRAHFPDEVRVRAIGLLGYLAAVILGLVGVAGIAGGVAILAVLVARGIDPGHPFLAKGLVLVIRGGLLLAFALFLGLVGRALRRFRNGARRCVVVLSALAILAGCVGMVSATTSGDAASGLALFAVGVAIPSACLYGCLLPRHARLFTAEYRDLVARTPRLRPRADRRLKARAMLALGILSAVVAAAILSRLATGR